MKYSFTNSLPKSIISNITKIWIFCTILSVAIIYLFGIYLNAQKNTLQITTQSTKINIDSIYKKASKIKADIDRLDYEITLDTINKNYSNELQNALIKLFALIPDQITITYIELEEKRLVLKGITPSREIYSFLLQSPLKSVFTTSRVDFFPLPNGWYNFTSISILDKE